MAAKKESKSAKDTAKDERELFKPGDRVRILHSLGVIGRIAEYRGRLGPGGARVYSVLLRRKPRRDFVEVLEDQLELVEASNGA
jgi:hypothetical protein